MIEAPSRPGEEIDVDVERAFELLSNERYRTVLSYLLERRRPVPVVELVDAVIAAESGEPAAADDLRSDALLNLHHKQLPYLASADVIDYDAERELVTVREPARALEPYLDGARGASAREHVVREL